MCATSGRTAGSSSTASCPLIHRSNIAIPTPRIFSGRRRLDSYFPGIDLGLVRLLIVAKGVSQRGPDTDFPGVWIKGQSQSAKSTTIRVVADICGETCPPCDTSRQKDRTLTHFAMAAEKGTFVILNEFDKTGMTEDELKHTFMGIEPRMPFHWMYGGLCNLFSPAVICMTGVTIPRVLCDDAQPARRIVPVDLGAGILARGAPNWRKTCGGNAVGWRKWDFPECGLLPADVADILISDVMDRFFAGEMLEFGDVARELGYDTLMNDSQDGIDADAPSASYSRPRARRGITTTSSSRGPGGEASRWSTKRSCPKLSGLL